MSHSGGQIVTFFFSDLFEFIYPETGYNKIVIILPIRSTIYFLNKDLPIIGFFDDEMTLFLSPVRWFKYNSASGWAFFEAGCRHFTR